MRVARIFNTYGPKMHMYDGKLMLMIQLYCLILNSSTHTTLSAIVIWLYFVFYRQSCQ